MKPKNKVLETLKVFSSHIWRIVVLVGICTLTVVSIWNWEITLGILGRAVSILMPFILGIFFALLINPFVKSLRKLLNKMIQGKWEKFKGIISIVTAYIVIIGILTVIIIYIYPQLRDSSKEMVKTIQNGYNYIINHQDEINQKIPFVNLKTVIEYIKENGPDKLMNYSSDIVPYVFSVSTSVVTLIYNILIGLVVSVYLIIDKNNILIKLREIIYCIAPKNREKSAWDIIMGCNHIFNGFLVGKMIDSCCIGVLTLIIMTILQLPYSLLMSVIVGITNMIPYFGPFIGAVPGVLIYLFIDPKLSLIFAIMIFAIQQFDGLYLGPKILGDLTGIKPIWVIFGVTVGGALFGVMGMFLGVPTVAVMTYLSDLYLDKKLKNKGLEAKDIGRDENISMPVNKKNGEQKPERKK